MDDLFVAPAGAMQFELAADTDYPGETFWVIPTDLSVKVWNWKCKCGSRYEVLMETVSAAVRPAFKPCAGTDGFAVCECVGRIIE